MMELPSQPVLKHTLLSKCTPVKGDHYEAKHKGHTDPNRIISRLGMFICTAKFKFINKIFSVYVVSF